MANKEESVVVIGLGRFGSSLALELLRRDTQVLAIDSSPKLVQAYSSQIPHAVVADATDPEALTQLDVGMFRRAVVAIGTDQEASILATANLADLDVSDIWAKATNRQHGRILQRVGAHHVVLPEHDMGERVAHLVSGEMLDYLELGDGFVIAKTRPPRDYVGAALGETGLRAQYGVTIVAVKPQNGTFTYADRETILQYGDILVVSGPEDKVERFSRLA
ncbi:potassium channel family protein [Catelliglobosispora koreensis]|uniref:potassium channel family protein n=1 Tax=Catelliglobosispora koreensis TaxID=129052 RepID=UPI0003794CAE|nr:TrkA family potassium uptake protein [Catelliglobosispora koreensis]